MEGPEIHQFMSLEKRLSDLDTVFDGISICGLHWDYILCVYVLLVSNKVSNSRRVRGNWMVQAVKQWVHCWFTLGCSVILTHTIQLRRITYSYSLVCSMVHLLVNSLCSPNFCWSTFNSCWINSQFLFGLNTLQFFSEESWFRLKTSILFDYCL